MTKEERDKLETVIADLVIIRHNAPDSTTFRNGRTSGSVAGRINEVVEKLKELINDGKSGK